MLNVSDFTKELFAKWYPFDNEPTAEEWKAVPQHFAPVQAIQFIKRQRVTQTKEGSATQHPSQEEIAAVSKYKSSLDHKEQIERNNATTTKRRATSTQSNNGSPRTIQYSRNSKAKRKRKH